MKFDSLHHVAVIASDYERSKDFYVSKLGFEVIAENYRQERQSWKLDLRVNDATQIELFTFPDAPKRPSHPEAQGLRHLAFAVKGLDKAVNELTQEGIEVEPIRVDPYTHKRFTFFADPDGLPLELYEL